MIWDFEKLNEDADTFDLADILGMEVRRSGSTKYIPCLSGTHSETKYNHNQLFRNGCHCYSCGASQNPYGIVKDYYNNILGRSITVGEIGELLFQACGGDRSYYCKGDDGNVVVFPLTKKELELIGLAPQKQAHYNKVIVGVSDNKKEGYQSYRGEYVKFKRVPQMSLQELYEDERDVCVDMLMRKTKELIDNCEFIIRELSNKSEFSVLMKLDAKKKLTEAKLIRLKLQNI